MNALPADPFDGVKTSSFLRLSNDCPKEGILVHFNTFPPKVMKNTVFGDKDEYHWDVCEITFDGAFAKDLVESSPGFRASLKNACGSNLDPTGRNFLIRWKKENISKGRQQRVWTIKELSTSEANTHVSITTSP